MSKTKAVTIVTTEQAEEYLQKLEQSYFVDEDDSEELNVADGEYFLDNSLPQFGYDSDNDDTILRGNNEYNTSLSDTINDSPDFYDSDEDYEVVKNLKNKYRAMQKN